MTSYDFTQRLGLDRDTATDWTQYDTMIVVPSNIVTSVAVRPRAYADFVGTAYFDDMSLVSIPQTVITAIKEPNPSGSNSIPTKYDLDQNYPNPFNPSTTISFTIPLKSFVSLKVFDALGRKVSTIVSEEMHAGRYSRQWNAEGLPSGVYFYHLEAGTYHDTKKLLLLK